MKYQNLHRRYPLWRERKLSLWRRKIPVWRPGAYRKRKPSRRETESWKKHPILSLGRKIPQMACRKTSARWAMPWRGFPERRRDIRSLAARRICRRIRPAMRKQLPVICPILRRRTVRQLNLRPAKCRRTCRSEKLRPRRQPPRKRPPVREERPARKSFHRKRPPLCRKPGRFLERRT